MTSSWNPNKGLGWRFDIVTPNMPHTVLHNENNLETQQKYILLRNGNLMKKYSVLLDFYTQLWWYTHALGVGKYIHNVCTHGMKSVPTWLIMTFYLYDLNGLNCAFDKEVVSSSLTRLLSLFTATWVRRKGKIHFL